MGGRILVAVVAAQFSFFIPPNASYLRPPDHRDNGFVFCRLAFRSDRSEAEGTGWRTDFPRADQRFMERMPEITTIRTDPGKAQTPRHWVVQVDSPEMFLCPFLVTSDVGTMNLSDTDAENLKAYLMKGGFLWVDDFWGPQSWDQWLREIAKFMPPGSTVVTPTWDHPIYNTHYRIRETLQVSNLDHWLGHDFSVQERGDDSPLTPLRLLVDIDGHVLVVMTHNSDVQDTWEREGDHPEYFLQYSPDGYALGTNVILHAMAF